MKRLTFAAIAVIGILILSACATSSADVASLSETEGTKAVAPTAKATDTLASNEAMMMAFTQCLRDRGMAVLDPVVDSDGNVDKPEFVEGAGTEKRDWGAVWEACDHHLKGFVWEQKRVDRSEELDGYLALAACLSEKGYDVVEPTAETLDQWMGDFKQTFDWEDRKVMQAYQACIGGKTGQTAKGTGK